MVFVDCSFLNQWTSIRVSGLQVILRSDKYWFFLESDSQKEVALIVNASSGTSLVHMELHTQYASYDSWSNQALHINR